MESIVKNKLAQIIHSFKTKKIMVIGDLMLDQYTWGEVDRISPEAPIPVLRVKREDFRLGGAANVVYNLKVLECDVYPVGVTGNGVSGQRLMGLFKDMKIPVEGIVNTDSFKTIVKKRVLTDEQQLVRIDYESNDYYEGQFENQLKEKINQILPQMEGVVISDYVKGVLNQSLLSYVIKSAKSQKIPIVCDPGNGVDYTCYKGVTTIKPNRPEAEKISGIKLDTEESILKAAAIIQEKCKTDFLSISLDRNGILYYQNRNHYQFITTEAKTVYDVTGAGDTVISVIIALLSNRVSPELAIQMANVAAGIEISYMGVVAIPWSLILKVLNQDGISRKLISLEALKEELELKKTAVIFTNGYFDQLSAGHLRFLLEVGKIKGKLIVAINSDQSILSQKGSLPLLNEKTRSRLLASLENVHRVIIFDDENASELIEHIKPHIVVKGEQFKDVAIPEQNAIQAVGAKIQYVHHFEL
jgi:D-beta-D-heptose 7-phosphate kinase / D-beta-D-heptose 1-phosphate adenosyltransferase